jgi:hypothetical protein
MASTMGAILPVSAGMTTQTPFWRLAHSVPTILPAVHMSDTTGFATAARDQLA